MEGGRDRHSNNTTLDEEAQVLYPRAKLANQLLCKEEPGTSCCGWFLGVWVEMLCYAAHHCSRPGVPYARQLSISGGELVTAMWLLTTAEFNHVYYSQTNFKERKHGTVWNFLNFVDFTDFINKFNIRKTIDKVGHMISLNRAEMRWGESLRESIYMNNGPKDKSDYE